MPDLHCGVDPAPRDDWRGLAARLDGDLVLPGADGYEPLRKPVGQRFHDIRPAAIVRCLTAADVSEAIIHARGAGLPVALRSGGHDFAGRSTGTGMVIDLSDLNQVVVDGTLATVGPGARLAAVHRALAVHGRALPAGCGPTVAIAGLALGGGLGVLGRLHGLTCDHLLAATVVLVDGGIVRCDEDQHADLFWALRGAGAAGVGIVTELVFDTVPASRCAVYRLTWSWRHAADVIAAWQSWSPDAPDGVAASLLLNAPADPARPASVTILGSAAGHSTGRTARLLATLADDVGAEPQGQEWQELPWLNTKTALADAGPGDEDGHLFHKSEYFRRSIPRPAVDALVEHLVADRLPGEARELDFSPWGGAYNHPSIDATAFPHRLERFLLKHGATVKPDGSSSPEPSGWLEGSWRIVHPHGSGGVYPNFPDPTLSDPDRAYWGPNVERLRRVKATYDPSGILPGATSRHGEAVR